MDFLDLLVQSGAAELMWMYLLIVQQLVSAFRGLCAGHEAPCRFLGLSRQRFALILGWLGDGKYREQVWDVK